MRCGTAPAADPQDDGHAALRAIVTEPNAGDRASRRAARPGRRGHLRAARRRLHAPSFERGDAPGHLRRPDREDPLPPRARRDACGAAAGDGVRRAGRARRRGRAGLAQLLGLQHPQLLRPHPRYCIDPARAAREFRALVDALHDAGIGVLLDVVFNHTAEGGATGPTINFKGLANEVFYHLDANDRRRYRDYTGCGNTRQLQPSAGDRTSSCTVSNTGWRRSAWTASGSTSRACSRAASTAS